MWGCCVGVGLIMKFQSLVYVNPLWQFVNVFNLFQVSPHKQRHQHPGSLCSNKPSTTPTLFCLATCHMCFSTAQSSYDTCAYTTRLRRAFNFTLVLDVPVQQLLQQLLHADVAEVKWWKVFVSWPVISLTVWVCEVENNWAEDKSRTRWDNVQ